MHAKQTSSKRNLIKHFSVFVIAFLIFGCSQNKTESVEYSKKTAPKQSQKTKEINPVIKARQKHRLEVVQSYDRDTFPISVRHDPDTYRTNMVFATKNKTVQYDPIDSIPFSIPKSIRESEGNPYNWHFDLSRLDKKTKESILHDVVPYKGKSIEEASYGYMQIGLSLAEYDWYPPGRHCFFIYSIDLLNAPYGIKIGGISIIKIYDQYGTRVQEIVSKDISFGTASLTTNGRYLSASGGGLYGECGSLSAPLRSALYEVKTGKEILSSTTGGAGIYRNRVTYSCSIEDPTRYVLDIPKGIAYAIPDYNANYRGHTVWTGDSCIYLLQDTICYADFPSVPLSELCLN